MTLTTPQAFNAFLATITPTENQRTVTIPSRKSTVEKRLAGRFPATSDLPYARAILMGSASKGTIIRPIDDVDVLVVFSNVKKAWDKYRNDSQSFIYRIRDAYDGISVQQVGTRGQAVRVFYKDGGHVDVAPVFSRGEGVYRLPNGTGGWLLTAPTVANTWFAARNQMLGYRLVPVVRMLKAWNRTHSKRMQSFHLETVAASAFKSISPNHRTALQRFFEWAPKWVNVSDPGGQGGNLSTYLTQTGRKGLLESFASAAERAARANEAEARGDHAEAKRLWALILGSEFPTN
jgi:hypothetical protein